MDGSGNQMAGNRIPTVFVGISQAQWTELKLYHLIFRMVWRVQEFSHGIFVTLVEKVNLKSRSKKLLIGSD